MGGSQGPVGRDKQVDHDASGQGGSLYANTQVDA